MSVDERVANLEQAFLALNRLAKRSDERHESTGETLSLLTEMLRRADERMDEFDGKLNTLADEFDGKLNALAEAQARTEANLSALTSIVGDTEKRLDRLAETVDRYIEGRNGQS